MRRCGGREVSAERLFVLPDLEESDLPGRFHREAVLDVAVLSPDAAAISLAAAMNASVFSGGREPVPAMTIMRSPQSDNERSQRSQGDI